MGFDPISFLLGSKAGGGGGGVTVESKSISANGTYTAPTGKAYSPVTVNVPNSYTAGDEGKVVSSGALVSQTAHAEVTQNGTIDTTLNNSVVVNVPASSSWTLLGTDEFEVSTTSTSIEELGTIEVDKNLFESGTVIWVHIRDKAGQRDGYFYGSDTVFIFAQNSASVVGVSFGIIISRGMGSYYSLSSISYGVYSNSIDQTNGQIKIRSRYNSGYGTIDGTFKVDVYKLTPPFTMFA